MFPREQGIAVATGRWFGDEHLPINSLRREDELSNGGELSPTMLWRYNRATKTGRFVVGEDIYGKLDLHTLLGANEANKALHLISQRTRIQRRGNRRAQHMVSVHCIRDNLHRRLPHICVTTLTRVSRGGLPNISGMAFRIPAASMTSTARFECVGTLLNNIMEQLGPYYAWLDTQLTPQATEATRPAPFDLVWRCGKHIISPSRFSMLDIDGDTVSALSLNQARFIALLLGATDRNGMPNYLERSLTRRKIFNLESTCTICDNDIDKLVMFFRQHLGQSAITTLRGYGHVLTMQRRVCDKHELAYALERLWR